MKRLSDLVAKRLAAGVDPGRLEFVINATENPRQCSTAESKHFILPTPLYRDANTALTFADAAITLTGIGASAKDAAGNPSGWFDPAGPVTIRFTEASGAETATDGRLPLHHSIIIGNVEHRFTISAGARSFVEVTAERCPFP